MREAVVILAPDVRCQQVVERRDLPAPGNLRCHLQPFGMLVEHRVDDVGEGLVAVEEAVSPGQQVALEPALALVLAEHFHDPPGGREEFVGRQRGRVPLPFSRFERARQADGQ